jgi:hypothetical protein
MTQEVTSVARIGLFGRRTEQQEPPTAVGSSSETDRTVIVDRDKDGVDDRVERQEVREERLIDRDGDSAVYRSADARDTNHDGVVSDREAQAAHERTEARLAARERLAAEKRVDERPTTAGTAVVDRDGDGVDDRTEARPAVDTRPAPPAPAPAPKVRARASLVATIALIVGLTSVYAALTGRLAPIAVALGVLGLLLSFAGLSATGRPRIAGGGLAVFALLLSVGGAVLGVLAMNGTVSWLDGDVDQVSRLRDWLDAQLPFMANW